MSTAETKPTIGLPRSKRTLLIIGVLLMAAGFTFSGYGSSIAAPTKLAEIDGTEFYALSNALSTMGMMLSLPLVGWLSGRFGPKAVALFGIFFQLIARVIAVLSPSPVLFIISMTLSQIGAGLYLSLSYTFISNIVPPGARTKYFGLITTCNALGALAGPLMVGQAVDWGYASLGFVLYAPLSVAAVILIMLLYPKAPKSGEARPGFDLGGILLMVTGICCVVLWLSLGGKAFDWISPVSLALVLCGAGALWFLGRYEKKQKHPSVPLHMFKKKRFTTAFLCMSLMTSYGTCAAGFCIFYTQQIMQVSSKLSATVTMPQTIVQAILGIVIGRVLAKNFAGKFRYFAVAAPLLTAAATFLMFTLTPGSSMLVIYAATTLGGMGMSIAQTAFTPFFQTELEPEQYAEAQGMYSFGSNGGSCIFSALAGVLLNAHLTYNHIFLVAFLFNMVALVIGLIGFKLPRPERAVS